MSGQKLRYLTQAQMNSEQGLIYGRAPIPGAMYDGSSLGMPGVYFDSRGCECLLPGAKRPEPEPEPQAEPVAEESEDDIAIRQLEGYLNSFVSDEQKNELVDWMEANLDKKYNRRMKLSTLKKFAMEDYIAAIKSGDEEQEEKPAGEDDES